MNEPEIRSIALVRAVEETQPDLIPATLLVEAQLVAADRADGPAWIARRARYLAEGVLARLRPLGMEASLGLGLLGWIVPLAFVLGLSANYLDPTPKIHVLLNPIFLLVLWNLGVYAVPALLALRSPARPQRVAGGAQAGVLARLLQRLLATRLVALGAASGSAALRHSFVSSWLGMMRPVFGPAVRVALHVGAIGMALGAVAGMYLRGLFFEYEVVWRSTFIDDPTTVAQLLRLLLGPATLLLGQPWISPADAVEMMSEAGSPAARWIHAFSATVLVAVLIPRAFLAALGVRTLRRALRGAQPDLSDPYYVELVRKASLLDAKAVRESIHHDVRKMCEVFSDDVASFVSSTLYDARIAPAIDAFRASGGKLADLEARMHGECERFQPELEAEILRQQRALEAHIAEQVAWRLGEVGPGDAIDGSGVLQAVGSASDAASSTLGDRVGAGMATSVAAIVSTAVGVIAGGVSGGFGHSLGTAILVGLVHSGPLAWILGAIGGAALAGAGFYLGRDALRDGVKRVPLPRVVTRSSLWRLDRVKRTGRERCQRAVHEALSTQLEAAIGRIAEGIWQRLEPQLGERLRPIARS
jgi:hypothetical protein